MNESFHIHECIILYVENRVISHTLLSRIMYYMIKLSHIHQWFMSYIWMSHVTYINASFHLYEWVISCPSRSQIIYIWMKHVTYISASCHICNKSCHIRPWVIFQIWMSLFCIHQRVMSWVWMSHLTHIIGSCRTSVTCECVMSHTFMSHVTCMNQSSHIHQCFTSYIWMSHVTYIHAICYIYEWVTSHTFMRHAIFTNESCHLQQWRRNNSYQRLLSADTNEGGTQQTHQMALADLRCIVSRRVCLCMCVCLRVCV